MGTPGKGIEGAKNDLANSLIEIDEVSYTIEELFASTCIQI